MTCAPHPRRKPRPMLRPGVRTFLGNLNPVEMLTSCRQRDARFGFRRAIPLLDFAHVIENTYLNSPTANWNAACLFGVVPEGNNNMQAAPANIGSDQRFD